MVRDAGLASEVAQFAMQRNSTDKNQTLGKTVKDRATTHETTLNQALKPFYHGVASGDPLSDRVIIWTRITPERDTTLLVGWEIAADTAFRNIVKTGAFPTNAARDYTVKVDVTGLEADKTYYYRFTGLGRGSIIGRTKTLPVETADVRHARVGVVSCSSYPHGFFNAYARLAERNDLDAVLHLGDYIYEYNASETSYGGEMGKRIARMSAPANEIVTLADYRTRYSQYRLDPDLMRLHQQHPMVHIWDDHESANDSYSDGAENHTPASEGAWAVRKATAKRVVYEWLPTRETADSLLRRRFRIGNLVDVFMLDTRLEARDEPISFVGPDSTQARREAIINDPNRNIIGKAQYDWLTGGLRSSTARWKLLGNQVMFSPMMVDSLNAAFMSRYSAWLAPFASTLSDNLEDAFYGDVWTNYPAERKRVVDFLQQNTIKNVVIATGDFHTSFAMDVTLENRNGDKYNRATGAGAVAVEFMCPSISSANFDENFYAGFRNFFYNQLRSFTAPVSAFTTGIAIAQFATPTTLTAFRDLLNERNPFLKLQNLTDHGYTVLDFTPDRVQGDYWFVDTIVTRTTKERFGGGLFTRSGESNLQTAQQPAPPKSVQQIPAPPIPSANVLTANVLMANALASRITPALVSNAPAITVLASYPNPATSSVAYLNYVVNATTQVTVRLVDAEGKERAVLVNDQTQAEGARTLVIDLAGLNLPSGMYRYVISTPLGGTWTRDVVLLR